MCIRKFLAGQIFNGSHTLPLYGAVSDSNVHSCGPVDGIHYPVQTDRFHSIHVCSTQASDAAFSLLYLFTQLISFNGSIFREATENVVSEK